MKEKLIMAYTWSKVRPPKFIKMTIGITSSHFRTFKTIRTIRTHESSNVSLSSPPLSNILLPSRRYENYKRSLQPYSGVKNSLGSNNFLCSNYSNEFKITLRLKELKERRSVIVTAWNKNDRYMSCDHSDFSPKSLENVNETSSLDQELFVSIYNNSKDLLNKYNNENLTFKKEEKSRICDFVEKNKNDILKLIEECQDYLSSQSTNIVNFPRKEVLFCLKQKTFILKLYISAGQRQGANFLSYFYLMFRKETYLECSEMFTGLLLDLKEMISTESRIDLLRNSIFTFNIMFTPEKITVMTNLPVSLVDQNSIDSLTHECLKNFIQIFILFKQACLNVNTKYLLLEEDTLFKTILKENTLLPIVSFLMNLQDSLNQKDLPKDPPTGKASGSVPKLLNGQAQNENNSENSTKFEFEKFQKKNTLGTYAVKLLTGGILFTAAILGKGKILRELSNPPLSNFTNTTIFAACPPFAVLRSPVSNPNASQTNQDKKTSTPSLANQAQHVTNPNKPTNIGSSNIGSSHSTFTGTAVPVPEQAQVVQGVSRQTALEIQALKRPAKTELNYKCLVVILYNSSLSNFIYYHPYSNSCFVPSEWSNTNTNQFENGVNQWILQQCKVLNPYYCYVNFNAANNPTNKIQKDSCVYTPFGIFGYSEKPTDLIEAAATHFKKHAPEKGKLPDVKASRDSDKKKWDTWFSTQNNAKTFRLNLMDFLLVSKPVTPLDLCHRTPYRFEQVLSLDSNIANQRQNDAIRTVFASKLVNTLSDDDGVWRLTSKQKSLYDFVNKGTELLKNTLTSATREQLGLPSEVPNFVLQKFKHDLVGLFSKERTVACNNLVESIAADYPTIFTKKLEKDPEKGGQFILDSQQDSFIIKTVLANKLKHVFHAEVTLAITEITGNSFSNIIEQLKTIEELAKTPADLEKHVFTALDGFNQIQTQFSTLNKTITKSLKQSTFVYSVMEPLVASLLDDLTLETVAQTNPATHTGTEKINHQIIGGIKKTINDFKLNQGPAKTKIKNFTDSISQLDSFIVKLNKNHPSEKLALCSSGIANIKSQIKTFTQLFGWYDNDNLVLINNTPNLIPHYNQAATRAQKDFDNLLRMAEEFKVNSIKGGKAETNQALRDTINDNPNANLNRYAQRSSSNQEVVKNPLKLDHTLLSGNPIELFGGGSGGIQPISFPTPKQHQQARVNVTKSAGAGSQLSLPHSSSQPSSSEKSTNPGRQPRPWEINRESNKPN